ncbi:NFX1-type zinc finger-containing protein 1-like [Haliotis rufescens]|uniref:NFX1-type zinc finger-containing protein 1-like n=1 Tax=Haliotis rufescens TaxID=6454 RepID=UPI00201F86CE|nr:NFX1-type zinc finger-containing protein 1-like [Haliotis rufescens]XP_046375701.2 NFX1-type zinc finger-containing protein 1-like [Haliotis rufescens]
MDEERAEEQPLPQRRRGACGQRGKGRRGVQNKQMGPSKIKATELRDMSSMDPAEALTRLSRPNNGLMESLKQPDLSVDATKSVLAALSKACQCESMPEGLNTMIMNVLSTPFLDSTLLRLLTQLGMNEHGDNGVVRDCLPLMKEMLSRMPTDGWIKVQTIAIMVQSLWQKGGMKDEDLNKSMLEISDLLLKSRPPPPSLGVGARGGAAAIAQTQDQPPPENFRELPIIPRKDELDGTTAVFLLPNKVKDRFRDLEHYLECQFRLFRADVIMPLKKNIADFQNVAKNTSVGYMIYTDVQIIRPVCSHNGLGYRLAFDTTLLRHVNWGATRRLIFGSLLCLSSDYFKDNIFFATVDQREKDHLKNGLVDVQFISQHDEVANITRDVRFSMVESPAYFESYKYILEGMQELTERNFPFQQYIVECQNDVQKPLYFREQQNVLYDLRPLLDEDYKIKDLGDNASSAEGFPAGSNIANDVNIEDISKWPMPNLLHLNVSQRTALRNALMREFVLIQGPPGTGKTYLGIKILKVLLHNSQVWLQGQEKLPILIVCYTNHALDQFLEGILKFFKGRLIRVGARSKSEIMQEYSLKNARQRARDLKSLPLTVHEGKLETLRAMDSLKAEIHTTAAKLEVAEREIVHERCLKEYMTKAIVRSFSVGNEYETCQIVTWLGIKKSLFDIEEEGEYLQHQLEERKLADEDEEDEYEEEEEMIDISVNHRNQRQLEEDLIDSDDEYDYDDIRSKAQGLDADIQHVRRECMGLDITNLDASTVTMFMPPQQKTIYEEKQRQKRSLKVRLIKKLRSTERMKSSEAASVRYIWKLQLKDRWRMYRYWVHVLCQNAKETIRDKESDYRRLTKQYKEVLMQEDRTILQNCSIIGMTTTAAARYQKVLNEIGPKIIVVEEAAEVLEAHIVGTLSRRCQHLILIGDHLQLRPNPTVHDLAKKYNLEISLFERMVNSGLPHDTLLWQHRMRPEIADIIRPLYKDLKDDKSVQKYDNVKGIARNVYFIDHQHPHEYDKESKSFKNEHEAQYLVGLCKYLLKQGYGTEQITILTTYSAQMHCLKNRMPKSQFEGVRVVAVDSYQGEENDIVLLSLVRSGEETKIGFLNENNRICVALSRAKKGLYVIGNFSHITTYSPLLKDIATKASMKGFYGPALPLSCQNHPDDMGVGVIDPRDFERVPEGGCTKPCLFRLACGHVCPRMCHVIDAEHKSITCSKPCKRQCRKCKSYHCDLPCYQPCKPCPVLIEKTLPRCGHVQMIPCEEDELTYQCQERCNDSLPCGHGCQGACGQPHLPCREPVEVTRPCGHTIAVECRERDTAVCNHECGEMLICGDQCKGKCGTCHQGRLHQPCSRECKRILICGHECESSCSNCLPCTRRCENRCNHSKCSQRCGDPCTLCKEQCQWKCYHFKCNMPCGENCDRPRCDESCRNKLECGHDCIGMCGEPCPKLCRDCDKDKMPDVFLGSEEKPNARFIELEDCKHIFEVKDLDRFMDESSEDKDKTLVQLKTCPRCNTPIRRNLRYGNIIKQALLFIEEVKRKDIGDVKNAKELRDSMDKMRNLLDPDDLVSMDILLRSYPVESVNILTTQARQMCILGQISSIQRTVKESLRLFKLTDSETYETLSICLTDFKAWALLSRSCFGEQEVRDAQKERDRLSLLKHLIDAREWIGFSQKEVPERIMRNLEAMIKQLECPAKLRDDVMEDAKEMKEDVMEFVPESSIGVMKDVDEWLMKDVDEWLMKDVKELVSESVPQTWSCGHTMEVLCTEQGQARCLVRCDAKLVCGHTCEGSCFECNEGRLHIPCTEKCTKILICGHPCKASCFRCPPCDLDCETACPHSKCQNPCGQKCQQCDKPCEWACAHFKCKQLCGDVCDRNRCDKRCRKKLKCKHPCIGLCGEPCPGYCRICHKDDVSAFLTESEDITTARFILLEKCGHIVEVHVLDRIMENVQASKEIQLPCCPLCSTPIRRNTRYGAILNLIHKQMEKGKAVLAEMTIERLTALQNVIHTGMDSLQCVDEVSELIANAGEDEARLVAVKNQKTFLTGIKTLKARVNEPPDGDDDDVVDDGVWYEINQFEQWLKIQRGVFTEQEASDAHHEFQRISISVFLHELLSRETKDDLLPSTLALLQRVRAVIKAKKQLTEDEYQLITELKHDVSHVFPDIEFYDKLSKDKMPVWRHLAASQGRWFRCPVSDDHIYCAEDDLTQDECHWCQDHSSREGNGCEDSRDTNEDG